LFQIRELKDSDINQYLSSLINRINWLDTHNLSMWKIENVTKDKLIEMYKEPLFFGGFENNLCIGGFILINKDHIFWPENISDKAFYFHKLVTDPKYSGQGYSSKLLKWIIEYGKDNGKSYIRLDYDKNRPYLRNMYLSHGFEDVREIETKDGKINILAEYKYRLLV
jgi:GNAT superfamily N-acetyltransferase